MSVHDLTAITVHLSISIASITKLPMYYTCVRRSLKHYHTSLKGTHIYDVHAGCNIICLHSEKDIKP